MNAKATAMCLASVLAGTRAAIGQTAPSQDQPPVASAETNELELGPNTGSQPKPPRQAPEEAAPKEGETPAPGAGEASRFHLSLGADFTNAYFSRGIKSEDSGLIVQPYADLSLDVLRLDYATVSLKVGTWNSFHGLATGAVTTDGSRKYWYECDLYAGVGLEAGKWALEARYYWDTSPSDAFLTIEELYFSAAFDDSEYLGAWSLKPTAIIAIETGNNTADGIDPGSYLQLGVAPEITFDAGEVKELALSFPVSVGLSLHDYYQGPDGESDVFGYTSVGATLSVPLQLGKSWGEWTFTAGVQGLYLGGVTSDFNEGDHFDVIATAGISVDF